VANGSFCVIFPKPVTPNRVSRTLLGHSRAWKSKLLMAVTAPRDFSMILLAFNADPDLGSAIFSTIFLILILLVGFVLYFLPTLAARGKQCFGSVLVLNLFLGWTLVGWVVALAWAVKDPAPGLAAQAVQTVPVAAPRLCSNCGKYSTSDSKFCSSCGLQL